MQKEWLVKTEETPISIVTSSRYFSQRMSLLQNV